MEANKEKGLEKATHSADKSLALSVFPNSKDFIVILKKTERLVSAMYLITSFFSDQEPIKWRLRSLGANLLSSDLFLTDNYEERQEDAVKTIRNTVVEIENLLSVARNSGLVSGDNYSLIEREFSNLLALVFSKTGMNVKTPDQSLGSEFFDIGEDVESMPEPKEESLKDKSMKSYSQESKNELLPKVLDQYKSTFSIKPKPNKIYEEAANKTLENGVKSDNKAEKLKSYGAVSVKKTARQSIIINLAKRKKEIMIKDVSPLIEGVSDKTIQRELLAMVDKGILKKEGEKRWSKYSLA